MPTEDFSDTYLYGSLPRQCLPILTGLAGAYYCSHCFAKQHIHIGFHIVYKLETM